MKEDRLSLVRTLEADLAAVPIGFQMASRGASSLPLTSARSM
jgi:hypothetical protein